MRIIKAGATDQSVEIYIIDSTDGTPETGVVFNTSGIDLKYRREGATVVAITEADLGTPALGDAHADGGFLAIGNGVYRLDVPDAAFGTGADSVVIFGTVTGMIVLPVTVQLVDVDLQDTVRMGLTALPNAAADAAFGLPISDAGGLDLDAQKVNIDDIETDTADMQPRVVAIEIDTATTLQAELDGIQEDTEDLQTQIGTAGAGLTAVPWNAAWDVEVQSEVQDALDAAVAEPTGVPAANESLSAKISYLFMALRNKVTVTSTKKQFFDDGGAAEFEKDLTDDGTTYAESEANAI